MAVVTVSAEAGIFNMHMQRQGNNTYWKWLLFNAVCGIFFSNYMRGSYFRFIKPVYAHRQLIPGT